MELSSLAEDIHVKIQNVDLDMRIFLGIDKVLQTILDKLPNNVSKLTDIDKNTKKIVKSSKKLKMVIFILKSKGSYIGIG